MTPGKTLKPIILILFLLLGLVGGAAAQGDGLTVLITQVDSQTFPQVTTFVTVADPNGPVFGLTADAFRVMEDGKSVPAEAVTAQSDNTQNLNLTLALDTSMPEAELTALQNAVNAFIDTLGAQDQVAIIAFFDETRMVQNFTDDKRALKNAVSSLEPEGDRTALNEAAFQSVSMVSALPAGRKGVIIFTNSADNVSGRSVNETQDKARALGAPLFFYGFGSRVETDVLQNMAAATGGQAFILSGVDQVADNLEGMSLTLRQGYRVDFQSALQADNAEHELLIRVSHSSSQGEAQSHFTAHSAPVTLAFASLADGQTVGGRVTLEIEASAPAPVALVEYLLNGKTLAEVKEAPYSYAWNSSDTSPGLHTLTARVIDSAGNEGQLDLKLKVVDPIVVTASASKQSVEIGDKITIKVDVEALNEVMGVDFLVDGKLLQSDNKAPYALSLDTGEYRAGEHTITAQARDSLNQSAETELSIELTASPKADTAPARAEETTSAKTGVDWKKWLNYILIAAAVLLFAPLLFAVIMWQKRRAQAKFRLDVVNQGNIRSRYVLRAVDDAAKLKFSFALGETPLPRRRVSETKEQVQAEKSGAHDFGDLSATLKPGLDYGDLDEGVTEASPEAEGGGGMMEKAGGIASMAGVAGELLYLVGSLMPRALRTPIQQLGSRMRRGRMAMRRVERVSKKAGIGGDGKPSIGRTGSSGQRGGSQASRGGAAAPGQVVRVWSQTPYIEPGHTLSIDLSVDQAGFFQTNQNYPFKIFSRSIEIEDADLIIEEAVLQPKSGACLMQLIKLLLIAIAIAIPVALCVAAAVALLGS